MQNVVWNFANATRTVRGGTTESRGVQKVSGPLWRRVRSRGRAAPQLKGETEKVIKHKGTTDIMEVTERLRDTEIRREELNKVNEGKKYPFDSRLLKCLDSSLNFGCTYLDLFDYFVPFLWSCQIQYIFGIAVFLNGVCDVMCPLAQSYLGLVMYSLVYGAVFGAMGALLFEVLMDLVGPQRFASAVGLVTMAECCPVLLGPPFGGWLVDLTGQYRYMYVICGLLLMVAGGILLIGHFLNNWCKAKKSRDACPPGMQLHEGAQKIEEEDVTLAEDKGASTA
uniref:Uncharacterized protein n=1 Tax=Eptatretus burgeri TaxID=7764 RepID=A0A8C4QKX6_EPTBU